MTIREILTYPNDILTTPTRDLTKAEILSSKIQTLIEDMKDTCHAAEGVGLAANQIGEDVSIFVIRFKDGFETFINPSVKSSKGLYHFKGEGCLSLPGMQFKVKRAKMIELAYLDEHGEEALWRTKSKFTCQAFQHEIDHLKGILLIDKGKRI
jgi:peptide deformylase